ncbi:unnamed protein product [Diatraea saccharalis]|uniref:MICAL-like protein 1 n=1 Tax=Diatraea saccharalis TaxID=40085 RepID=A0A9N9QUV6_9NEOP|nr:unnamed protein product [Diatraea saccharalis]
MSERRGTKALELWCKRLVKDCPEVQIDNMTTSWRNGIAFCALVHHFRPDLIDLSKLKPENIYENNQLAFSIAEKHLGIPALLDPEDMVESEVPDRLSILTYLSQFYQRLGHTVNTKSSEAESKATSTSSTSTTPIKFGKSGLDKCAACGLPVYLAQRLIVSHKLYHRRCFRCSKCSGHMNPKNFDIIDGSEFTCDSCKNEKSLPKYLNNNDNDQMGMLAFNEDSQTKRSEILKGQSISSKQKARPLSIIEKINLFEKNSDKEKDTVTDKISNLSLKDNVDNSIINVSAPSIDSPTKDINIQSNITSNTDTDTTEAIKDKTISVNYENMLHHDLPPKVYKSNINKFNFLQTQLSDTVCNDIPIDDMKPAEPVIMHNTEDCSSDTTLDVENETKCVSSSDKNDDIKSEHDVKEESNVTDESRLAKVQQMSLVEDKNVSDMNLVTESIKNESDINLMIESKKNESAMKNGQEVNISVPPRRKKQANKSVPPITKDEKIKVQYPDHLNPFSDDEEESAPPLTSKKVSTNPFGSSDEENDDVPPIQTLPKLPSNQQGMPIKRLITAYNPFWSDGEEPSSEDDDTHTYKSSLAASTPNLQSSTPRRKKAHAPPPPPVITVSPTHIEHPSTSLDDVASISSHSSYNSTIHSDQKSCGVSTPRLKKKRLAPTTPDSLSTISGCGSLDKGMDSSGLRSNISDSSRKTKGPAPGLPLPERREVKLQMSPEELQIQLDLLETQQLGLERQGVLIEQMIRDKCEGDEPSTVPQEEVEDLVIQLCELVNEKNDLFRKQTELMYIRRQQRLEQEQADIEHEIRVIQSRPAVNRIDADKAREEQLVSRLVEIVRMRDELVQQIDSERRRERQEDLAIATSIATKRAQRNSESNSSSMKSVEIVATPKKSKVKDKVKKQFKKAKHTLMPKKKEDGTDRKEEKSEKGNKS